MRLVPNLWSAIAYIMGTRAIAYSDSIPPGDQLSPPPLVPNGALRSEEPAPHQEEIGCSTARRSLSNLAAAPSFRPLPVSSSRTAHTRRAVADGKLHTSAFTRPFAAPALPGGARRHFTNSRRQLRRETQNDEVQARVHLARRLHAGPQPARQDADQGVQPLSRRSRSSRSGASTAARPCRRKATAPTAC